MRIFILANGKATRWENYMGVDKQLIVIDGEPLLNRTVRLLKENGFNDIVIVGSYQIDGATNYIPDFESVIGKYDIVRKVVADVDSFALLYGDCYYTEAIIKDLSTRTSDKKWLHWAAGNGNKITGKTWGEGYIHTIYDKDWWFKQCDEYHDLIKSGKHTHTNDWQFLRFIFKTEDLTTHKPELLEDNTVYWEDETDDFDTPLDYDTWMKFVKGKEKNEI